MKLSELNMCYIALMAAIAILYIIFKIIETKPLCMEYMEVTSKWELCENALYKYTSDGWVLYDTDKITHTGYYNFTMIYYFKRKTQ